jgi:hypothetical protein
MFLENPSSLTQVTIQDVPIEVIDQFANVERRFSLSLDGHIVPLLSFLQEPVHLIASPAGSYDTVCGTKHVLHLLRLCCKISAWALDDTNRVDPQVPHVKRSSRDDGVSESRW